MTCIHTHMYKHSHDAHSQTCAHTHTTQAKQCKAQHTCTHTQPQTTYTHITANKQPITKHPAHMCKHTPTHNAKPDKTAHLLDAEAREEVIGGGLWYHQGCHWRTVSQHSTLTSLKQQIVLITTSCTVHHPSWWTGRRSNHHMRLASRKIWSVEELETLLPAGTKPRTSHHWSPVAGKEERGSTHLPCR